MTDPLGAAVRAVASHLNIGSPDDAFANAVRQIAKALVSDGNPARLDPARLAGRIRLLALSERIGVNPFDSTHTFEVLTKEAAGHPAGRFVNPDRYADPGRALLELFALVYSSLAYQIQAAANANVEAVLAAAGVGRRPARPAAVIVRADNLPVGKTLDPHTTAFVPAVIRRKGGQPEPVAATPENQFRPAWPVVGWECGEPGPLGRERRWPVTVPGAALAKNGTGFQAYIAAGHDRVFELEWALQADGGTEEPLTVRPWAPTPAAAAPDYRARLDWFAFTAQGDESGARLADRWVTFHPASAIEAAGELRGGLIARPVSEADAGGDVKLVANCAAWVNVGPPTGGRTAFDRLGLWDWEVRQTAGDWFNGARVGTDEKNQEWRAVEQPEGVAVAPHALGVISGGRPDESDAEFLRRAPAALRHRGSPASAADWEQFVCEADPAERIAGAAARGALLPRGSMVAVGVQVLFHAVGPVEPAACLAAWLRDAWLNYLAVAVRPLGTEIELYVPHPVRVLCRPTGLNQPVVQRLKNAFDPEVRTGGDPNPLWAFLLDRFRRRGPAAPYEVSGLLAEFANEQLKQMDLAANAVTFQAVGATAGAQDTSAVPVPVWESEGRR
jgi:hypothetical protein